MARGGNSGGSKGNGGKSEGTVSRADRDKAGQELLDALRRDVTKNGGKANP